MWLSAAVALYSVALWFCSSVALQLCSSVVNYENYYLFKYHYLTVLTRQSVGYALWWMHSFCESPILAGYSLPGTSNPQSTSLLKSTGWTSKERLVGRPSLVLWACNVFSWKAFLLNINHYWLRSTWPSNHAVAGLQQSAVKSKMRWPKCEMFTRCF